MKNLVFIFQGVYYMIAGLWPLVHIRSFMLVTGPKTDIWLVQMVGLLSFSIGLTLLYLLRYRIPPVLNTVSAISFLIIDLYYALADTISDIYLADAILELVFALTAIASFIRRAE